MDWLFIVKPAAAAPDGGSSAKRHLLELAETEPRREWCLSRWRRMAAGDRLWIYVASPVREVAAVAEIEGEPFEAAGNPVSRGASGRRSVRRRHAGCTATPSRCTCWPTGTRKGSPA